MDEEFESVLHIRVGNYLVRRIDNYNIVVEQVKKRKEGANIGQEYFVNIGYYQRLETAFDKVLRLGIDKKNITSIKDVIASLTEAKNDLAKACNELDKRIKLIEKG